MTPSTCPSPVAQATVPAPTTLRIAVVGTGFSLLWSSAFIAGKIGLAVSGPLTLLSLRFLLAGMLLLVFLRVGGRSLPPLQDKWLVVTAGLLCNAAYLGLAYLGMAHTPAALTAIIVSTTPLMTSVFSAVWLREPIGPRAAFGLVLAFGGVLWVMGRRLHLDGLDPGAMGCILAGSVALALGTLLNRRTSRHDQPLVAATWQLLAAGLALLPMAILTEGLRFESGTAFWSSLLYQAGPVSIGTTLMMLWLVRHGGAGRASSFHLLNPFFSIAMAVGLLGENLHGSDLAGLLPLVAGLALALRRQRAG